jgi:hypothetical protein
MRDDLLTDLHVVGACANRLIQIEASRDALEMIPSRVDVVDLLLGQYDNCVLMERERLRRRLLHVPEALIDIRSGPRDDLDEALSWNGLTRTPIRASAHRMLSPCCVMIRAVPGGPGREC